MPIAVRCIIPTVWCARSAPARRSRQSSFLLNLGSDFPVRTPSLGRAVRPHPAGCLAAASAASGRRAAAQARTTTSTSSPTSRALREGMRAVTWKRRPLAGTMITASPVFVIYCLRTNCRLIFRDEETLWRTYTILDRCRGGVPPSLKSELGLRPIFHRTQGCAPYTGI